MADITELRERLRILQEIEATQGKLTSEQQKEL